MTCEKNLEKIDNSTNSSVFRKFYMMANSFNSFISMIYVY